MSNSGNEVSDNFGNEVSVPESLYLKVLESVCCTYSENLWIGLITDIDMKEKDAKIKTLLYTYPCKVLLLFGHKEMIHAGFHFQIFIAESMLF